jgi:hypothetical protein
MRQLTAGQKKALKQAAMNYKKERGRLPLSVDDLPYNNVVLPIDNMNPCEVFWQNANRFISDLFYGDMVVQSGGRVNG